jgi:protein-disulfide isomerase
MRRSERPCSPDGASPLPGRAIASPGREAGPGRRLLVTLRLGLALAAISLGGPPTLAQVVELTVDPAMVRGPADAAVTIVEFADYQCTYCRRVQRTLDALFQEFPGQIRLVHKDYPLARHELAKGAHEAARCAGAAGQYWAYHDRLYAVQPAFERPKLIRYAEELGLDPRAFSRCLESGEHAAKVQEDISQGRQLGIRGTPAFLINGQRLIGAHPLETFRTVVRDALRDARRDRPGPPGSGPPSG